MPQALTELQAALKTSKSGAAPGQSQVSVDMLKLLDAEGLKELLKFYNACLEERRVPDSINRALLRLLPKTDKGLKDLAATRPIALMENVVKVFEQMLIARILPVLINNEVLDLEKFGALPKAGVAAPLRILAEVLDDARLSGQPLHLMVADLSKAFDTMEPWAQALSWTCVGMPEPLVKLLVGLDTGTSEGPGATTQVIMGRGRTSAPFRHGRGVRQGSVLGPLKWVLFVNFWLQWVKAESHDGYIMSASRSTRTLHGVQKKTPAKVDGLMFRGVKSFCKFSEPRESWPK